MCDQDQKKVLCQSHIQLYNELWPLHLTLTLRTSRHPLCLMTDPNLQSLPWSVLEVGREKCKYSLVQCFTVWVKMFPLLQMHIRPHFDVTDRMHCGQLCSAWTNSKHYRPYTKRTLHSTPVRTHGRWSALHVRLANKGGKALEAQLGTTKHENDIQGFC